MTLDDLADPHRLPKPYNAVVTFGDLYRVLNEILRPLLASISAQRGTVTSKNPLTVQLDDGTSHPAETIAGGNPAVGSRLLVLYVPAVDIYYAALALA